MLRDLLGPVTRVKKKKKKRKKKKKNMRGLTEDSDEENSGILDNRSRE